MKTCLLKVGLIALWLAPTGLAQEEPKPEELTPSERQQLGEKAQKLNQQAFQLYTQGKLSDALKPAAEVLAIAKKLHAGEDHFDVAASLYNLGYLLDASGRAEEALRSYKEALAMHKRLHKGQDHSETARSLNSVGLLLQKMGRPKEALPISKDALDMFKRLHKGQDHPHLAASLNNVGYLLQKMGKAEEALPFYREALDMQKRLFKNRDNSGVATSLNNMGYLLKEMGRLEEALAFYKESLDMQKRLRKGQDHPFLASSLNNMGSLLSAMGQAEEALPFSRDALNMRKRLFKGQDHPDLAQSFDNVGLLLKELGRTENALRFSQQALDMRYRLFKDRDHPDLALSLNNMASLLEALGRAEEALPLFKKALDMRRRFYMGQDHSELAESLNNVGYLLKEMGRSEEALPFYTDALKMHRRLFKNRDHSLLAVSLNNMGSLLNALGKAEEALSIYTEALNMRRRLHKDRDHPLLAISLHSLGYLLKEMGRPEEALPLIENSLNMYKRLYKNQDHPHLAISLNNMGLLLQDLGRTEEALPFYKDALNMERTLGDRFAYTFGLSDAMARIAQFQDSRSLLLSASRGLPQRHDVHAVIWAEKASLARLFRARRQLDVTDEDGQLTTLRQNLRSQQRRLTGLLAKGVPTDGDPTRDRELADVAKHIRDLESDIAALLPDWVPAKQLTIDRLYSALRPGDVFVDLYRYTERAADPALGTFRYVAFITTREGSIRVELGASGPIDDAVKNWRRALLRQRATSVADASRHAAELRRRLWAPIEEHFPADTQRVFLSTDGDLGRLPFAALPASKTNSVLLERYAFASVESGPFLLEHLTRGSTTDDGPDTLLVTGGIEYDPPAKAINEPFPYLPGTAKERQQVLDIWGQPNEAITQSGHAATTDWLMKHLPKVEYAHLATHGEFRAEEYTHEKLRLQKARESLVAGIHTGSFGVESRAGLGVRNPLGYVGIVMAGANLPTKETPDRGVVAGTSIWPMDLSKLKLVVLSACETGLGQDTGFAGVANLQMAFHVAGCRNVIASLWEVDDEATSALMAKFYHALWKENKSPLAALREAQLYVYHHPEVAMNWNAVVKRGKTEEALRAPKKVAADLPDGGKRRLEEPVVKAPLPSKTPAKYWAAFVLSGIGQ